MMDFFHSPVTKGALTGVLGAAAADYHAFRQFKKWSDAATYDWPTAGLRWLQGAVVGALGAAGLGAL